MSKMWQTQNFYVRTPNKFLRNERKQEGRYEIIGRLIRITIATTQLKLVLSIETITSSNRKNGILLVKNKFAIIIMYHDINKK